MLLGVNALSGGILVIAMLSLALNPASYGGENGKFNRPEY